MPMGADDTLHSFFYMHDCLRKKAFEMSFRYRHGNLKIPVCGHNLIYINSENFCTCQLATQPRCYEAHLTACMRSGLVGEPIL